MYKQQVGSAQYVHGQEQRRPIGEGGFRSESEYGPRPARVIVLSKTSDEVVHAGRSSMQTQTVVSASADPDKCTTTDADEDF